MTFHCPDTAPKDNVQSLLRLACSFSRRRQHALPPVGTAPGAASREYGILYALASPELFPTKNRGTGNALVAAANCVFGIMAPIVALYEKFSTSVPIYPRCQVRCPVHCGSTDRFRRAVVAIRTTWQDVSVDREERCGAVQESESSKLPYGPGHG